MPVKPLSVMNLSECFRRFLHLNNFSFIEQLPIKEDGFCQQHFGQPMHWEFMAVDHEGELPTCKVKSIPRNVHGGIATYGIHNGKTQGKGILINFFLINQLAQCRCDS